MLINGAGGTRVADHYLITLHLVCYVSSGFQSRFNLTRDCCDSYSRLRNVSANYCVIVRFSAALLSVQLMRQVSCEFQYSQLAVSFEHGVIAVSFSTARLL